MTNCTDLAVSVLNKGGRPPKWALPTKAVRLPEKYIDALIEIAREWEEVEKSRNET